MRSPWTTLVRVVAGLVAVGAATLAYACLVERRRWTLRRFDVPVLAPGAAPFTVLHVSDFHLTAGQHSKQRWIRSLAELHPDLVVDTGDNIAGYTAVDPTIAALGSLLDGPGAFVLASNDYYAPTFKNPLKYLFPGPRPTEGTQLPWPALRDAMTSRGWLNLTNATGELIIDGRRVAFAGLDDPHLRRDRYGVVAGTADPDADVRIGVVHSPEPRVLDRFAADGYDLVLCGHTHGGQLRLPFYGAIVTNCGIDRRRSRWLSRWSDRTWLHVSAGLGTSPYAPIRFACPPEATLLTLVPRDRVTPPVG